MANLDEAEFGEDSRADVLKVRVVGAEKALDAAVTESNVARAVDEEVRAFTEAGGVNPPYEPRSLLKLLEHSNSLEQNVEAYATNIDGFGHRYVPVIDLEADNVEDEVASLIISEQLLSGSKDYQDPTTAEIKARMRVIDAEQRVEKLQLQSFFDFCYADGSFIDLRRKTRSDLEVIGNAYWEVLRDVDGKIAQFVYLPGFTVRLLASDPRGIDVETQRKTPALTYVKVTERRRFRQFVQVVGSITTYFKELGDPRLYSSKTGKHYLTPEDMEKNEPGVAAATEMMHFKVHSARSSYGIPRWIGALLSVLGGRAAEEVNLMYFENKSVPPLAILVSGGTLAKSAVERLESYIENNIRGKRNFHKILILEAEGNDPSLPGGTGTVKVELKPLTEAQITDALFKEYDERTMDKVGMAFRMPRLLRGDTRDFNRATAQAALEFAEAQVFAPERESFDYCMDRKILAALGIRHWTFQSNGPTKSDPAQIIDMVQKLTDVFPPAVLQELAEDAFGRSFPNTDAPWTKQPIKLTVAGVPVDGELSDLDTDDDEPDDEPDEPEGGGGEGAEPTEGDEDDEAVEGAEKRWTPPYRRKPKRRKRARPELIASAQQLVKLRAALRDLESRALAQQFASDHAEVNKDDPPDV